MKKLLFFLICLSLLLNSAFGEPCSIKPEKGTKGLSFSVRGLGSLGVGGVGAGIGGKYWRSEKLAYKLSFGFSGRKSSYDPTSRPGYSKEKYFFGNFSILPGFEYHYFPTKRISPYWGGGLSFSITRETRKYSLPISTPIPIGTRTGWTSWLFSGGAYISLGIEWFIIKNLSIAGDYQVNFNYQHRELREFLVPGQIQVVVFPDKRKITYNDLSLTWGTSSLIATFYF